MNDSEIDETVRLAEKLKKVPDKLGWKVTGILYGHGKVIVQAVTAKGKAVQFTGKVKNGRSAANRVP